jgi:hypothetical protein
MVAVDTLVHNFQRRTGIMQGCGTPHTYGAACYGRGGYAEIIRTVSDGVMRALLMQKMSITMRCHPFGPGQVTIERTPRTFWFTIRVDVQNDPRNFPPVRAFSVSIKQSQIRHQMAMVIPGQRGRGWRLVGDIRIQRRFVLRHPGIIIL